ncbi:MAG TPA: excinuclease ABC subunit UvrA, partial [Verrucomicrobiae bacterium]|nr:excinuclease ABC subunit UvrA [Verrucomicrobiae bacterium]
IEQRSSGSSPRSIIATTTEIYDYLRLLYAHIGKSHCPETGVPISTQSTSDIVDKILALPPKTKVMLLAPIVRRQKGEFRDVFERLAREGFVRARVDGELIELGENVARAKLDKKKFHNIEAVVDRLVIDDKIRVRLGDSVETTLRWGEGVMFTLHQLSDESKVQSPKSKVGEPATRHSSPVTENWIETLHSNKMCSPATGKSYDPPTPKHFSFNAPAGACPVCHGLGQKMIFDEALVVPDMEKSLDDGAIQPWRRAGKRLTIYYKAMVRSIASHFGVSLEAPYKNLPDDFKKVLMNGSGEDEVEFSFWRGGKISKISRPFEGVLPNLERLANESESEFVRNRLKQYMSPHFCEACNGKRLKPEILAVTLGGDGFSSQFKIKKSKIKIPGLSIMDVCGLSVEKADDFFAALKLTEFEKKIADEVVKEIRARLGFLKNVGLGYLTLDRESGTLSGGEAQRIRLATQIGAALVGVLYVLDEPSIGLHQRDNDRLLHTLKGLRDLGNTVLVVEHD